MSDESCSCMKYNSHVRTVNFSSTSSSCALRWAFAPVAASNSWTQLVRNSSTRFDVLCTRLQLLLLHGLDKTAGALLVAVHVSPLAARVPAFGQTLCFPKTLDASVSMNNSSSSSLCWCKEDLLLNWRCLSRGGVLCDLIAVITQCSRDLEQISCCCQPSRN